MMRACWAQEDRALLEETFQLDTNNVVENQYVLQSRTDSGNWNEKFTRMQRALRQVSDA